MFNGMLTEEVRLRGGSRKRLWTKYALVLSRVSQISVRDTQYQFLNTLFREKTSSWIQIQKLTKSQKRCSKLRNCDK